MKVRLDNCILAVNNAQRVFTIYYNFRSALYEAETMVSTKVNIGCVIYGIDKEVLQYLQSRNIRRVELLHLSGQ